MSKFEPHCQRCGFVGPFKDGFMMEENVKHPIKICTKCGDWG